jgi:hypothetical protein
MGTWKIHTRNPAGLHKSDDLVKVSPSRNLNFFRRENVRHQERKTSAKPITKLYAPGFLGSSSLQSSKERIHSNTRLFFLQKQTQNVQREKDCELRVEEKNKKSLPRQSTCLTYTRFPQSSSRVNPRPVQTAVKLSISISNFTILAATCLSHFNCCS